MGKRAGTRGLNRAGLLALGIGALAGACSPTVDSAMPAASRAPAPLKATGFATDVPIAADFVRQSRAAQTDFIPVGVTPPDRALTPRSPSDVAKLRQDLDSTRARHDAIAGRDASQGSTLADQIKTKKPDPRT